MALVIVRHPSGLNATLDTATGRCSCVVKSGLSPHRAVLRPAADAAPASGQHLLTPTLALAAHFFPRAGASIRKVTLGIPGAAPRQPAPAADRCAETFQDALRLERDLLGAPIFRHKPDDTAERRRFAAMFKAAQTIRSKMAFLAAGMPVLDLDSQTYDVVDGFARDDGANCHWLFCLASADAPHLRGGKAEWPVRHLDDSAANLDSMRLSLAAYVMVAGGYLPTGAPVRCATVSQDGKINVVANREIEARDLVIAFLEQPPF